MTSTALRAISLQNYYRVMQVPYEGHTHLCERGHKKLHGPTTKAYSLASYNSSNFVSKLVVW